MPTSREDGGGCRRRGVRRRREGQGAGRARGGGGEDAVRVHGELGGRSGGRRSDWVGEGGGRRLEVVVVGPCAAAAVPGRRRGDEVAAKVGAGYDWRKVRSGEEVHLLANFLSIFAMFLFVSGNYIIVTGRSTIGNKFSY